MLILRNNVFHRQCNDYLGIDSQNSFSISCVLFCQFSLFKTLHIISRLHWADGIFHIVLGIKCSTREKLSLLSTSKALKQFFFSWGHHWSTSCVLFEPFSLATIAWIETRKQVLYLAQYWVSFSKYHPYFTSEEGIFHDIVNESESRQAVAGISGKSDKHSIQCYCVLSWIWNINDFRNSYTLHSRQQQLEIEKKSIFPEY